jgi:hypothetical protein
LSYSSRGGHGYGNNHRRGSGGKKSYSTKHTSEPKPIRTATQLRLSGLGVGAEVELTKPYINEYSGENIGPEVGTKGVVVGIFGSKPTIKWDKPGKYGNANQVVEPDVVKVSGKRSLKRDILASIPFKKLEELASKWASFTIDEKGNQVSITRINEEHDENGYGSGDSEVTLIGTKDKDGMVNFDREKISVGNLPRSMRSMIREYYDSQSPSDIFGLDH